MIPSPQSGWKSILPEQIRFLLVDSTIWWSHLQKNNFIGNAARLWNKAPSNIINAKTISVAKKEIKAYCKTIPI